MPSVPMKKSSIVASIVLFSVLGAAAGGLALQKVLAIRRQAAAAPQGEPPSAVEVTSVRESTWQRRADLVGTVISTRSVTVSNELPGTVRSIGFGSGAIVEPGEVLLTLDDASDRADLAVAEAGVRAAEANREVTASRAWLAESEFRRLTSAADASAASRIELDRSSAELKRANADLDRAKAEVDLAKARVEQIRTRLDKLVIKAPFRGRTGLRNIHEGQYLVEGSRVVQLEEVGDTIFLDFAIPQEYIARVAPGTSVMASSDAFGPQPFRIEVVAVDAAVNNGTRNVRVRAVVDNREDRLRPGMFVNIEVPVDAPAPVLVVPAAAVRRTSYADQIFVLEPEPAPPGAPPGGPPFMRARQRFVKLGPAMGDQIVVLEGLSAGEQVAASGAFKLRDGSLVMPAPPAEAAAGEGGGAGVGAGSTAEASSR